MKYRITLHDNREIAQMNLPIKLVTCIFQILSVIYDDSSLKIYSNTKRIVIPDKYKLFKYLTQKDINISRIQSKSVNFTEIMYMHTLYPPESNEYREKILATIKLPTNGIIVKIGGFLLNHLNYKSIDILKDKGVDGKYEQLIELTEFSPPKIHLSLHTGDWKSWSQILK